VNSGTTGCTSNTTTVELRRSTDGNKLVKSRRYRFGGAHSICVATSTSNGFPSKQEILGGLQCEDPRIVHDFRNCISPEAPTDCNWVTEPGPVLIRGTIPAFRGTIVYRASLLYDASTDNVTLWYSGARFQNGRYDWRIATERLPASEFLGSNRRQRIPTEERPLQPRRHSRMRIAP